MRDKMPKEPIDPVLAAAVEQICGSDECSKSLRPLYDADGFLNRPVRQLHMVAQLPHKPKQQGD